GDRRRPAPRSPHPPLAAALGARAPQRRARAAAARTGGGGDDGAEDRLLRAPDLPRPAAGAARLDSGPRLGPRAGAPVARGQTRHLDLLLDAGEGLFERDRQVVAEVI